MVKFWNKLKSLKIRTLIFLILIIGIIDAFATTFAAVIPFLDTISNLTFEIMQIILLVIALLKN